MKRIKSIDTFRGICMFIMVYGHLFDWWLKSEDYWFFNDILKPLLGPIGATGFVFISGISTGLSYKKNYLKVKTSKISVIKSVRNIYFFRALLLLAIAIIYNLTIAIRLNDISFIWTWLILQTLSISLLMAYPLLKTSKSLRIFLGITLLLVNQFILFLLSPYQGQINFLGVLYHILYNPVEHYIIIPFFSIFLIGTVAGDIIFDINNLNNKKDRRNAFKYKFLGYIILFGIGLIFIGIFYNFPNFFIYGSYSSILYAFGVSLCIFSILITIEEYEIFKMKKSYRYLFYYSFYSFTIYIGHNLLYFLFTRQLSILYAWIAVLLIIPLMGVLLRITYKRLGVKASIKAGISVISYLLAKKIEKKEI